LLRRAVIALTVLLIPGLAWGAARSDGRDAGAGAKVRDAGVAAKASRDAGAGGKAGKGAGKSTGKSPKEAKPASGKPGGKDVKKPKKLSRYAPIEMFQINTKETLKLRFYDDKGLPSKNWKKRFDKFMRCHNTGTVFKMDPRLPRMLYQTARHFEGHRLEVISGYRSPKVAKNPKSPHKEGVACDFRVAGIANPALRDYLRKTFDHAGVGYYPNSSFVHLDNRKKGPSAFWIDYSGPGQAAEYAENPREDLRNGRAEQRRRDEANGRAEGADDVAQAGEAVASPGARAQAENTSVRKPVEVKTPQDTFGD
jgi:uncharacterized protein YcbK (DUF882 family)